MSRILTIRIKPMMEPRVTPIIAPLFNLPSPGTATRPLVGVGDATTARSTLFGEWLDFGKALDVEGEVALARDFMEDEIVVEIDSSFEDGSVEGNEGRWCNAEFVAIRR